MSIASKIINLLIQGVELPSEAAETAVENLAVAGGQLFLTGSKVDAAILAAGDPDLATSVAEAVVDFAIQYGQSRYHQLSPNEKASLKLLFSKVYNNPDEALVEELYNLTLDTLDAIEATNVALAVLPADAPLSGDPGDFTADPVDTNPPPVDPNPTPEADNDLDPG